MSQATRVAGFGFASELVKPYYPGEETVRRARRLVDITRRAFAETDE